MQEVKIKKFKKVLVANRGEIAIRVYRALNELGIQTVGIFSKEDKYSLFRTKTDEAYMLNPEKGPIDAYLDIRNIINIAKAKGVDAIHPGYGFLSENPAFVEACNQAGIAFIGPDVDVMYSMGDKISSKQMAIECNVPIIPGVDHAIRSLDEVMEVAERVGYPVMLKASNGGGGRGMRIVNSAEEMPKEFDEARNEAKKPSVTIKFSLKNISVTPNISKSRFWVTNTATLCISLIVTVLYSAVIRKLWNLLPLSLSAMQSEKKSSQMPFVCPNM